VIRKFVWCCAPWLLVSSLSACGGEPGDVAHDGSGAESGAAGTLPDGARDEPPVVEADTPVLPDHVEVPSPADPIEELDLVEDLSEEVANMLVELSDALRRRDLGQAVGWFATDFAGHDPMDLSPDEPETLAIGAVRAKSLPDDATILGRRDFVAALGEMLAPYAALESVVIKVKGAEFEGGALPSGRVRLKVSTFGSAQRGRPLALTLWAHAGVERRRGRWLIRRLAIESLTATTRQAPLFSDVTVGAGVDHARGIFGKDGETLFYWNGVASHDVNGDGLWDLFVPSTERSFLYLNQGDGTFTDATEAWGLGGERRGTGVMFLDHDADGDVDLLVSHVGWTRSDGTHGGDTLRLYRNDGDHFTDVSEQAGFDGEHVAYSLVAADYDGDGFTDVYVCSYNRMDSIYPESWYHAENGTPNALYRNRGDGTFEEVAAAWGADDSRWTFAAAAADFDTDGDVDLYLANDYGDNALLVNRGDGHFDERAADLGVLDSGNGMGAAWGDLDGDAQLDLYVANMSSTAGNRILSRLVPSDDDGTGGTLKKLAAGNSIFSLSDSQGFERLPPEDGGVGAAWAWSSLLADFDLDADLDVFVANGFISGESAADT